MMSKLVEESTSQSVPESLKHLLLALNVQATKITEHDLVFSVLCILMIECEFLPLNTMCKSDSVHNFQIEDVSAYKVTELETIPSIWQNEHSNVYTMSFVLGQLNYRCRLIAIPVGDIFIVNIIICNLPKNEYSMIVCCKNYVSSTNLQWSSIASAFHNLNDLSLRFKNSIAFCAKSAILNQEGILNASILGIPDEIKLKMLGYLPLRDLLNVSATCKYFNSLCNNQRLWETLVDRNVSAKFSNYYSKKKLYDEHRDWKKVYKEIANFKRRYLLALRFLGHE